jgi:DNA-directed RNA polymerase subunit RPC12/RpoP
VSVGVDPVRVVCPRCGYQWLYKGGLMRATCPNCGSKVKVGKVGERDLPNLQSLQEA